MIETKALTKKYGNFTAVSDLDLRVQAGELFVFLGLNGAGKTTTIKMLTGLLHPTSGNAVVAGFDVVKSSIDVKKVIGYLPDEPFLYNKLTGREFLQFIADMRGIQRKKEKIENFIELFEISSSADELIEGYSLGMKKKIAIGSAVMHDPKVLFLDEPTGGLDPKSAKTMKDLLIDLKQRGTAIFMTTHVLEIAERMCDRVGIINNGKLICVGTMDELRKEAQNGSGSLEDIFLELTGKTQETDIIKFLDDVTDNSKI
ncbi:TPA: ABC transporter ATP-binding protein [bacterium]|nr:ABC transporter ATP-binding protein [bacterium]